MRNYLTISLLVLGLSGLGVLAAAEKEPASKPAVMSPEELFAKASPAVVRVVVRDKDSKVIGMGSGFFISADGLLVTNYHVIKDAKFASVLLSNNATLFVDGVAAADAKADLALLKVNGQDLPRLTVAAEQPPKVGAKVYAIGNPQGLTNTLSEGIISGLRKIEDGLTIIQTTAAISPGSSGGPLLTPDGNVVGITSAYLAVGQNLNFAVPAEKIASLLKNRGKLQTLASAGGKRLDKIPTPKKTDKELTLDLGNKVTMKLALIPAGKFTMGSPKEEKGRFDTEGPQREVMISKAFYMGIYEVTQEQYEQIMGKNPSSFKGAHNPVESVSWNDAVEFCKKLSQKTGKTVSLPTEAQWEYACRAGSNTRFSYGDDDDKLGDYAWYDKNSDSKPHPVGQKKANDWGLYDMHGNVWEWCSDWYADSYANANKTDPTGAASGSDRVVRGGSWDMIPFGCRSADRFWRPPGSQNSHYGFRVSVDLTEPAKQPAAVPADKAEKEIALDLGNNVTMKLVLISAGKFLMGSPDNEKDRSKYEGPQREVTISKPFYMGVYEVTQKQWEQVMGTSVAQQRDKANKDWALYGEGANHPMYYVSWEEATEFCKKLSKKTGKNVTLPTEAQWEYACRAGSETRFSYGDDDDYGNLGDYAWYTKNSDSKTHPVGQKKPNDFGLYDMHGNVSEWCSDWYADSYANANKTDPMGAASGSTRVLRGGCWFDGPGNCRSAYRVWRVLDFMWIFNLGFRVSVDLK